MYSTCSPYIIRSMRRSHLVHAQVLRPTDQSRMHLEHGTGELLKFKINNDWHLRLAFCLTSAAAEWLTHLLLNASWNKTRWWYLAFLDRWASGVIKFISWFCQGRKATEDYIWCLLTESVEWLYKFARGIWIEVQIFWEWDEREFIKSCSNVSCNIMFCQVKRCVQNIKRHNKNK